MYPEIIWFSISSVFFQEEEWDLDDVELDDLDEVKDEL